MGSLVRLAKKIEDHKKEITRAKRKAERELKKSVSSYRRSSSSLASIERNVEAAKEQMGEISKEMVRAVEQRESVKRLIAAAESKLESEKYEKTNAEQEIKFSDGREEKKTAQFKLDNIVDSIDNIKSEIKIRTKMISKLTDIIDDRTSSKSKISWKFCGKRYGQNGTDCRGSSRMPGWIMMHQSHLHKE